VLPRATGAAPAAIRKASTCKTVRRCCGWTSRSQDGQAVLRLDFPERVTDGTSLRKMLVRLAGEARSKVDN